MMPEYLEPGGDCVSEMSSSGRVDLCYGNCSEPVKEGPGGRWFITIGHPGFNSSMNNRRGYLTKSAAFFAMKRYGGR